MTTSIDLLIAACALAGLMMVSLIALAGWREWLTLKRRELDLRRAPSSDPGSFTGEGAARIELADLKERVRRLEAIASGVDL